MPMLSLLNRLRRDTRANAVVEFAFVLPIFLSITVGTVEFGRAIFQANAVDKGVRAGALYAARSPQPLSAATIATAENLVRTGTLDGSGPFLATGWARAGASVTITTSSFAVGTESLPVIRVAASVPYDPLLPNMNPLAGLTAFNIKANHEQAYVGD